MKKLISLISAAVLAVAVLSVINLTTGCTHLTTVTNGVTNTVTVIDTNKLAQVQAAIEPTAASVIRRAIQNSPQHAQQIGDYARAAGKAICASVGTQQISPLQVAQAIDNATQPLQAGVSPDIIDAKNAVEAVYAILFNDKLTVALPNNQWPYAVLQTICGSLDKALKDAGQAGIL